MGRQELRVGVAGHVVRIPNGRRVGEGAEEVRGEEMVFGPVLDRAEVGQREALEAQVLRVRLGAGGQVQPAAVGGEVVLCGARGRAEDTATNQTLCIIILQGDPSLRVNLICTIMQKKKQTTS